MWNNSIISKPTIQTVQGRFIEKVALIWLDTIVIIIEDCLHCIRKTYLLMRT